MATRIWKERNGWADKKEEETLEAMNKEGITKAAQITKARK